MWTRTNQALKNRSWNSQTTVGLGYHAQLLSNMKVTSLPANTALATRARVVVEPRATIRMASNMGIGFTSEEPSSDLILPESKLVSPKYGLTGQQMHALGLTKEAMTKTEPIEPEAIRAKAFYVGDAVTTTTRQATRMGPVDTKAPGQAPPDLPSLLLDSNIVVIGMPLVPSVTELVISELLWLNYASEKPIYLYINSVGSQDARKESVAFDQEATAIMDTMNYVRPDIYTLVYGRAFGNAAMILASGKKGHRFALPHATIKTCPPRLNRSFGNVSDVMIKANELEKTTEIYVDHIARFTGKEKDEVRKDVGRDRYFTPEQAVEYGLIDSVVGQGNVQMQSKDYEAMLRQTQARMAARRGGGGGAQAGAQ